MTDEDLTDIRQLAGSVTPEDRVRLEPPPAVWDNIVESIRGDVPVVESDSTDTDIETERVDPLVPVEAALGPVVHGSITELDAHRLRTAPNVRRRHRRVAAVAAVAAIVAGVVGVSFLTDASPERLADASITNQGLPEPYDGTASATVELAGNQQRLALDFEAPLPEAALLEVWLIKDDFSDMTSLGLVDDVAYYVIPAGVDIDDYPVLDISVEPDDGDPTHSGRSILRGELQRS